MKKIKAFTLAETLITLTILGVVAAITVPSLINKQTESANRTKIKKAMAVYEKALNQMIIDNDIKNDTGLAALNDATCSKTYEYFKIVEKLNNSTNCEFKTADRVYWNISDIQHPIISTDKEKRNDTTFDKTFTLAGYYDNEVLRINDLGAAKDTNKTNLKKVYEFVLNKTIEEDDSDKPLWQKNNWKNATHYDGETNCEGGVYKNCYLADYDMAGAVHYISIYDETGNEEIVSCTKDYKTCSNSIVYGTEDDGLTHDCYTCNNMTTSISIVECFNDKHKVTCPE